MKSFAFSSLAVRVSTTGFSPRKIAPLRPAAPPAGSVRADTMASKRSGSIASRSAALSGSSPIPANRPAAWARALSSKRLSEITTTGGTGAGLAIASMSISPTTAASMPWRSASSPL